jgi:hypothetical protein
MLQLLAEVGDKLPVSGLMPTIFALQHMPRMSVLTFFLQLASTAGLQDEQAILVLILIERLCHFNEVLPTAVHICSNTVYR